MPPLLQPLASFVSGAPALTPFQVKAFRMLWTAWLIANMTMWMNDVAAAWLMTTMTNSPAMVALVQTASTLPVFLLGLPSGAMADIADRRRYFAATQLWVAIIAVILALVAMSGSLTPNLLVLLTFLNGVGLAMRWPVFSAIVPEIVGKERMPAALALSGISMNLSRVIGPVIAGALLGLTGGSGVFLLNAVLALLGFALILRWQSVPRSSPLPGERFMGAMRIGLQHVRQSPRVRTVLIRIFLFFFQSTALMSMLPLIAKHMHGGGAGTFTALLSATGVGAIVAAFWFPRWRAKYSRDQFVWVGTIIHAAVSALVVTVPELWVALPAMFLGGMAWISTANSLSVSAQLALPDWVRARGMSIYQMSLMGGAALGSLVWGQLAKVSTVESAVLVASAFGALTLMMTRRLTIEGGEEHDFTPALPNSVPEVAGEVGPDEGPVMVTVEYEIDPAMAVAFTAVMEETRRARLRLGVNSWGLFRDVGQQGRYIEYFVDESWVAHQRRLARFTASDVELRERRQAFQRHGNAPKVTRYVGERVR